jgi:hypothetical protein
MKMNNEIVKHTLIIANVWKRRNKYCTKKSKLSKINISTLLIVETYCLSMRKVDITDQFRFSYLI